MIARFSMDRLQTVSRFTRAPAEHDLNGDEPFSQECIKIKAYGDHLAMIATNGSAAAIAIDPESSIEDMNEDGFLFLPPTRIYQGEIATIDKDEITLARSRGIRTLETDKHIFNHTDSYPSVEKYISKMILAEYKPGLLKANLNLIKLFAPEKGNYEPGKNAKPIYFWHQPNNPKASIMVTTDDPYWLGILGPLAADEIERKPNKVIRAIKHGI